MPIQDYKMYRIERLQRDYKVVAHFDDGYYTVNENAWVKCDKEGNVKMTREDAINKIRRIDTAGVLSAEKSVELLEALGLLKFEVEKKEDEILVGDVTGTNVRVRRSMFESAMHHSGYKISKA